MNADRSDPAGSCYVFRRKLLLRKKNEIYRHFLQLYLKKAELRNTVSILGVLESCPFSCSSMYPAFQFDVMLMDIANVFQIWSTLAGYEELAGRFK